MRILLTGDKGYIGAVMVPMLIQEGHTVTGLDSDWFEHSAFSPLRAIFPAGKKIFAIWKSPTSKASMQWCIWQDCRMIRWAI